MKEHELIGKTVTWTSRGVVKTGVVIAEISGYHFPSPSKEDLENILEKNGTWSVRNNYDNYPNVGQKELQKIVENYGDTHTINFCYQDLNRTYINWFKGLKKNNSFIVEVVNPEKPNSKPKLYHPYPKNLRPVE